LWYLLISLDEENLFNNFVQNLMVSHNTLYAISNNLTSALLKSTDGTSWEMASTLGSVYPQMANYENELYWQPPGFGSSTIGKSSGSISGVLSWNLLSPPSTGFGGNIFSVIRIANKLHVLTSAFAWLLNNTGEWVNVATIVPGVTFNSSGVSSVAEVGDVALLNHSGQLHRMKRGASSVDATVYSLASLSSSQQEAVVLSWGITVSMSERITELTVYNHGSAQSGRDI